MTYMLPSTIATASATQMMTFSVLYNSGHTHRYRRFALTLTSQYARLAEICVWFKLHTLGLTPAKLCPLAWHTAKSSQYTGAIWVHSGFFVYSLCLQLTSSDRWSSTQFPFVTNTVSNTNNSFCIVCQRTKFLLHPKETIPFSKKYKAPH